MQNRLSNELARWRDEIRGKAVGVGLDFFEVIYEMVDYREVNELASLGGFPQRYPHWRFGMEYDRLSKSYAYGLSKIYEMVINTDPCYAYLLASNSLLENKLVMAHVYGHSDFFKNNQYFAHTNRRMLDEMANHATRVRRHQENHGVDTVENFMDWCLSLENLIDPHGHAIRRVSANPHIPDNELQKIKTKGYLDSYVNPKSHMDEQRRQREEDKVAVKNFPERPERDVLGFLLQHAPLKDWQVDCLEIVRDEACYFAPQGQTKIMNEGWASFWHTELMTKAGIMDDSEVIDFACVHSGTVAMQPGGLNPYKIGLELFRHIEDRWNKGQFGKEWEECQDYVSRQHWDRELGLGREKIFEVRKLYNDLTFIDTFLTEDFCRQQKLFTFAFNKRSDQFEIESREFEKIKQKLLLQLTNFGQPVIEVLDANHKNRGELLMDHVYDGRELRADYAQKTLQNLERLWSRPVAIRTNFEGKAFILSYDGKEFKKEEISKDQKELDV